MNHRMSGYMFCGEMQEMLYIFNYCSEPLCSEHRVEKAHIFVEIRDAEQFTLERKFDDFADLANRSEHYESEPKRVTRAD